jgi:hypothetical protein
MERAMIEPSTETSVTRIGGAGRGNHLTKNTDTQPIPSAAYAPYDQVSGETERFSVAPTARQPQSQIDQRKKSKAKPEPDLAQRDAIRRNVDRAIDQAGQMLAAAASGDMMEVSNAGFQLTETLQSLWALRGAREENWGDLLDLLQTMLAKVEFESLTSMQCEAIRDVLTSYLKPWTVEDDDVQSSIRRLRGAGFDPWRGISGPQED